MIVKDSGTALSLQCVELEKFENFLSGICFLLGRKESSLQFGMSLKSPASQSCDFEAFFFFPLL